MDDARLSEGVAVAIELMHCASLVHDDLPCFDDAKTRRGRASVHFAYGEPLAVLTGDALIVLAFQTLAAAAANRRCACPA
jgi:geranylgeranyl diphosphate synthase type II